MKSISFASGTKSYHPKVLDTIKVPRDLTRRTFNNKLSCYFNSEHYYVNICISKWARKVSKHFLNSKIFFSGSFDLIRVKYGENRLLPASEFEVAPFDMNRLRDSAERSISLRR